MHKFRLPKKKVLGLYLLIIGIVVLLKILFVDEFSVVYILLIIVLFASIDMIVRALKNKKKEKSLYIPGLILCLTTVFLSIYLLLLTDTIFTIEKLWPLFGIFSGISLISYYFIFIPKSPSTIVPGIFITIVSIILLASRIGFFCVDFKKFLLLLIPAFIILIGLYFIFDEKIKELKNQIKYTLDNTNNEK